MKICFLNESFFGPGDSTIDGTQVQMLMLARELAVRGHQTVVLAGGPCAPLSARREIEGIQVLTFRAHRRLPLLGAVSAAAALRRVAPDVTYVRGRSYLAGVAAWQRLRRRTRFVWASNGEDGCERWKQWSRLWGGSRSPARKVLRAPFDLLSDLMCDLAIPRADRHVCQTEHQRLRLQAVHGKSGVVIRTLHSRPVSLPPRGVPPMVLWIGRLSAHRRPEAFVELARLLASEDCDLVLLGPADPDYLGRVLAAAHDLPRFRYVSAVPFAESWEWIARASVLVNTSLVEGVSNALVQAWHCGTPTVVLSLDPDGLVAKSGCGFRSGDVPTMARDVRRLLTDAELREAMGAQARALADREFSVESVVAAYEVVLQSVVPSG